MKICLLTDAWKPWWGGGQVHVWEIAQRLVAQHNCAVDIVVPNLVGNNEDLVQGKLRIIKLGKPFVFPSLIGRLKFLILSFIYCWNNSYDIYHSHCYSTTIFLPLLRLLKHKKIVFTLHGLGSSGLGAGIFNYFRIPAVLNYIFVYLVKYDALITVAKRSIEKKTRTKFVAVIGNGVNLKAYD